jgi:hypothetical protein
MGKSKFQAEVIKSKKRVVKVPKPVRKIKNYLDGLKDGQVIFTEDLAEEIGYTSLYLLSHNFLSYKTLLPYKMKYGRKVVWGNRKYIKELAERAREILEKESHYE